MSVSVTTSEIRTRLEELVLTTLQPQGFSRSVFGRSQFGKEPKSIIHGSFIVNILNTTPRDGRQKTWAYCETEVEISVISVIRPTNQVDDEHRALDMAERLCAAARVTGIDYTNNLNINVVGITRNTLASDAWISTVRLTVYHNLNLTLEPLTVLA